MPHLEDGEREALPEQEACDQLHQVGEHTAAEAGQLLELVPQTELEGHLQGAKGTRGQGDKESREDSPSLLSLQERKR